VADVADGTAHVSTGPNQMMTMMDESFTPPRLRTVVLKESDVPTTCTTKHYFHLSVKGEKCPCGKYGNP
jgi:hypothetical protein